MNKLNIENGWAVFFLVVHGSKTTGNLGDGVAPF